MRDPMLYRYQSRPTRILAHLHGSSARTLSPRVLGFLAVLWVAVLAAVPTYADGVVFPPGSRIGLVPPSGFIVNPAIRGFDDKVNEAAFLTFELPAEVYSKVEQSMTPEALKQQGMTLEKREELSLKDGKAVLLTGPQEAENAKIRKWILIAGLPDLTALVTVQVPDAAKDIYPDATIRAALETVTLRTSVPVSEQVDLLPYRLDDLAGLRVMKVIPPSLAVLTDGPQDTMDAVNQPHMLVTIGPGGPTDLSSRQNFSRNLLFGITGFSDVKMTNAEMLRLNGQQIYEILADAKDAKAGADLKVVQWIRFGSSAYIQIVAMAPQAAWTEDFPRFRAVRDGINPK
jgi:hypothetical protein